GLKSRIRGLQSHKHKVESIGPGNRVAVNLVGIEVDNLARGMVIATPGWLEPTQRVDIQLHMLADAPAPLEQNSRLDFFTGSTETPCQITLLDTTQLEPGDTAWAQLRLRDSVALTKGDRYILRRPSPSLTIGGGQVVDSHPRRHKRFHEETLQSLETLQRGTPEEIILEALGSGTMEPKALLEKASLNNEQGIEALGKLVERGIALSLGGTETLSPAHTTAKFVIARASWEALIRRVETLLSHYHHHQPLRRGMSKEELRSRLSEAIPPKAFPYAIALGVSRGLLAEDATTLRLPTHEVRYSPAQLQQVERLRQAHSSSPYSPPSPADLFIDAEVLATLVESGEFVKIDDNLLYTRRAYDRFKEGVLKTIDEQGEVNVASMRDLFGTTRKYAIPFLEHLDEQKITRRKGDVRVRW
ncbi:MAG: SelB C-terminal domain-containing protein, partial [Chloroflexota bacterium]|nr:SelB C-terminal domain-containing protein [Chloroflexota bacterium]